MAGLDAAAQDREVPLITKEELKPGLCSANLTVIDVRAGESWTGSDQKIKCAVREDPGAVASWAGKYPQYRELVLYCAWLNEATSSRVGRKLMELGFTRILVLKGGWREWLDAGYPTQPK